MHPPTSLSRRTGPPRARPVGPPAALLACLWWAACGGDMVASPYPAARATVPVEDDSGLEGTAIAGSPAAAGGAGGTTGADGGQDQGAGAPQDGNELARQATLSLHPAGRRLLSHAPGAPGEKEWVADLRRTPEHLLISLWPRAPATRAELGAAAWPPAPPPAVVMKVSQRAPLGVQLDAAVAGEGCEPGFWWGRVRLDALPASRADGAAAGDFQAHGPQGSVAGRFWTVGAGEESGPAGP